MLDTLSGRVRYPDSMGDTFYQSWQRSRGNDGVDPSNDNFSSAALYVSGGSSILMNNNIFMNAGTPGSSGCTAGLHLTRIGFMSP